MIVTKLSREYSRQILGIVWIWNKTVVRIMGMWPRFQSQALGSVSSLDLPCINLGAATSPSYAWPIDLLRK